MNTENFTDLHRSRRWTDVHSYTSHRFNHQWHIFGQWAERYRPCRGQICSLPLTKASPLSMYIAAQPAIYVHESGKEMNIRQIYIWANLKLNISDQIILRALRKILGLRCCSKWFEQLSSRISGYVANSWFSSRHRFVPGLWNKDGRSDCRLRGCCRLR